MLRKISTSIATAAFVVPGVAAALSVGSYQLNSHLNQPLDLRVQLSDVRGLDEHEIVARLATKREFDNAGIDFDPINNNLRFTVTKLDGDRAEVRVVSRDAVREPFVSLLVEYVWPRGRMLREYNLLLNPSTYAATRAPSGKAAPQQAQAKRPPQTQPSAPVTRGGAHQYTIRANDTLWDIAIKNRPSRNVSVQQTMLAIQEKNPSAFINNNINMLKSGATLQLPTEKEVLQRTGAQATTELERQANEQAVAVERDGTEQGRVTLLGDSETAEPVEASEAEAIGDEAAVQAQPADSAHATDVQDHETASDTAEDKANTQQRFAALEEELQEAEERLQLQDQRISELQQVLLRLQEQGIEIDPALLPPVETADADTQEHELVQAEEDRQTLDETETDAETEKELALEAENQLQAETEEQTTPDEESEAAISGLEESFELEETAADTAEAEQDEVAEVDKLAPAAPLANTDTATQGEQSLAQRLLSNSLLVFSLLGALLLAVLLWLFSFLRRREKDDALFGELADELPQAPVAPAASIASAEELEAEAVALMQEQRYAEAVPVLRNAAQQNPTKIALKESLLVALFNADKKAYQQEVTKLKGMDVELDRFIEQQQAQQGTAQFDGFPEMPIVTETFIDDTEVASVAAAEEPEQESFTLPVEEELDLAQPEEGSTAFSSAETLTETEDIDQLIAAIEGIDTLEELDENTNNADGLAIVQDEHDEHDTGLGLARAMINMGNEEDARDILADVLRGGSEKQQAAAQQLLDDIDR